MWKAIAVVWVATAAAVVAGLYYTNDPRCLWALLVPTCISFRSGGTKAEG